jgi:hypothetical protein
LLVRSALHCTAEVQADPKWLQAGQAVYKKKRYPKLSSYMAAGHDGGMEEYQAVQQLVSALPPSGWVVSQTQLLNRPTAPILILVWKQPQMQS